MPFPTYYRKTRGIIQQGVRADQPAVADVLPGTLYFVTDEDVLEQSNGVTWVAYSVSYAVDNWTPAFGASGGASGQVYDYQVGKFIKTGRNVQVSMYLDLNTLGTLTGNIKIVNFPFTTSNDAGLYQYLNVQWFGSLGAAVDGLTLGLEPNDTIGYLYYIPAGGGTGMPIVDDGTGIIGANTQLIISGSYISET